MAAQQPAQVPLPPDFALAPGVANINQVIDYSTRAGQQLYRDATAPLSYTLEGKKSSLPAFLLALSNRATEMGWDDVLDITVNGEQKSLLTQYGEVTLENVKADADYINTETRQAQMSYQLYQCLSKSITTEVADRMVTETNNFRIPNPDANQFPVGNPNHPQFDGPCYLVTLIQVFFVQTEAKPTELRLKIASAKTIIQERNYDIDWFNTEINSYVQQLHALGETSQDVFAHLSQAYKSVPDRAFKIYITNKIDDHNDGTRRMTTNQLMSTAKAKYDEMVTDETWMEQDETDKQLVALKAEVHQLQLDKKALTKKVNQKPNDQQGGAQGEGKPGKGKGKGKNKKKKGSDDKKYAWKKVAPSAGESKTKVVDGKTYHWCKHHQAWTLHEPKDCRLKDHQDAPSKRTEGAGYQAVYDDGDFDDLSS